MEIQKGKPRTEKGQSLEGILDRKFPKSISSTNVSSGQTNGIPIHWSFLIYLYCAATRYNIYCSSLCTEVIN